jgi:ribulose-phosphate 3-epimerase
MLEIAPSILAADLSCLGNQLQAVERGGASIIHVDVMDGHFVPNITFGIPMVKAVSRMTRLPVDTHLMISDPGKYAERFVEAGASMVSIHVEADPHLHRTLIAIKEKGAKAGIVINPATSLSSLEDALPFADYVLLMSVNPGFGGQSFISASFNRLRRLRQLIKSMNLKTRIEIDGGIDINNIAAVVAAGAEIIVSGTSIFGEEDPAQAVRDLIKAVEAGHSS